MAGKGRKKEKKFNRRMQTKLSVVFAFVLLLLGILLIRITVIIGKSGNRYARQVLSQQNYDSQTIPSRRGEILDRNGIVLARSDLVYNVILDCRYVNDEAEAVEPTVRAASGVFGLEESEVRERLTSETTRESQYQILKKNIPQEEKDAFDAYVSGEGEELTEEQKKERSLVRGIWFEQDYKRYYPYDSLASDVIGFSNDIDQGVTGMEASYDSLLSGTDGRIYGYLNEDSEFEKSTIDPDHGKTLVSTIDMNLQSIVEKYIAEFDEAHGTDNTDNKGAKNVGVVIMDPNNGEILAMADNTGYNLNEPRDLSRYYSGAEVHNMTTEQYTEALNENWVNFCVSESFEPGSVFKPVTVASALECGAVKDEDHFYCDGGEFVTDTQINCDNIYGHGDETLEYAIVNSCNDALMQIGMKMSIPVFCNYQKAFGFGSTTGLDLPNESAGVIYDRDTMHEVELATCTFGQGFTVSMIQEITAFSAVINGGILYQPHILKQVRNDDGSVEKDVQPLELRQPVSSQVSELLRQYLTTAVQKGTGRKSQVPGYLTGGKTGTAEKIDPETGRRAGGKYLVSFIGACPMNDPQVVIYVIVDEPNVDNQADSSYPQVLFREIATEVFPALGLYPTEEVTTELLSYLGLTQADVVKEGDGNVRRTPYFQAFDSYGNFYNDAYVNRDNEIINTYGTVIEGAYIDDSGYVFDGYGNQALDGDGNAIRVGAEQDEEDIDPTAENPGIASPPDEMTGTAGEDATTWAGVTNEDLSSDEEG